MKHIGELYKLKTIQIPKCEKNEVISGENFGGEKLTYSRRTILYTFFSIFGRKFRIILRKSNPDVAIFLRPLKKHWDVSSYKLPPNLWGKKEHPMTNIWVRVNKDYFDINKTNDLKFTEVYRNHKVISMFKNKITEFIVPKM